MEELVWDDKKRQRTLRERGLDFADAGQIIFGDSVTFPDVRREYGEPRFITVGFLDIRMVIVVWTPRGRKRRIISMRKANEREIEAFQAYLD